MSKVIVKHHVALVAAALLALPLCACDEKSTNGLPDTTTDSGSDVPGDTTMEDSSQDQATEPLEDTLEEEAVDPCTIYPCTTYGTALGNVVPDLGFTPGNARSQELAGTDGTFDLHDLWALSETNGGDLTGLFIFLTAGWCPWCSTEATQLEAIYEALSSQGIMFVAVVSETNSPGTPADATFASSYATSYGFTFPTVAGDLEGGFWEPDVPAAERGIPLHVFIDLRSMRLYGRYSGSMSGAVKIVRYACEEIATDPRWVTDGVRDIDFDCAPGTGTENEPNSLADIPEVGTPLPFGMDAVFCPPAVADGVIADEDVIDLGTLTAGTVIDVTMDAISTGDVYPSFQAVMLDSAGTTITWSTIGPVRVDGGTARRQWVIDTTGHYLIAGIDGRMMSGFHYGDAVPPGADACCEGGPDFAYSVDVTSTTLAANETAPVIGTPSAGAFALPGDLRVYPLDVTTGTHYSVTMTAGTYDNLDPYLVVVNAGDGSIIGFNDDINYSGGNYNSNVAWTSTFDGQVLIAASYWFVAFNGTPSFTLSVTN